MGAVTSLFAISSVRIFLIVILFAIILELCPFHLKQTQMSFLEQYS